MLKVTICPDCGKQFAFTEEDIYNGGFLHCPYCDFKFFGIENSKTKKKVAKPYGDEVRKEILELRSLGYTLSEISKKIGPSRSYCGYVCQIYNAIKNNDVNTIERLRYMWPDLTQWCQKQVNYSLLKQEVSKNKETLKILREIKKLIEKLEELC